MFCLFSMFITKDILSYITLIKQQYHVRKKYIANSTFPPYNTTNECESTISSKGRARTIVVLVNKVSAYHGHVLLPLLPGGCSFCLVVVVLFLSSCTAS